ncbi:hypothetical protein ACQKIC_08090 [Peribacillus sp. NPDC046944]
MKQAKRKDEASEKMGVTCLPRCFHSLSISIMLKLEVASATYETD